MIDAVIIGGGPAGYSCALGISRLGGKAVLVEKEKLGGVCANWGCIPTKALQATAKLIDKLGKADKYGIKADFSLDFQKVLERAKKVSNISVMGISRMLDNHGVEVISGTARLVSKDKVRIEETGKSIEAKNVVIASGSKPITIEGVEGLTSRDMLELRDLPKKLLVIGGGAMGVEFATIFSRLGSEVTVVEMEDSLIPGHDEEVSQTLRTIMERAGVRVLTSSRVEHAAAGKAIIKTEDKRMEESFDKVLVSVGRKPCIPPELDSLGIRHDNNGIEVDANMQTSVKSVYAIGDVAGGPQLAHVAHREGIVAAENIMGAKSQMDYGTVPVCIFTMPEIASVGLPDDDCKSAKAAFAASGRARASGETRGFVKVFSKDGRLASASIIGENATELITEAVLLINSGIPIKELGKMMWAHPTLSETLMEAIGNLKDDHS